MELNTPSQIEHGDPPPHSCGGICKMEGSHDNVIILHIWDYAGCSQDTQDVAASQMRDNSHI